MHECSMKMELRCASEQTVRLGSIYAVWGVQRALARDHLVTEDWPATSSAVLCSGARGGSS